jgi:hypothetical protein
MQQGTTSFFTYVKKKTVWIKDWSVTSVLKNKMTLKFLPKETEKYQWVKN